MGTKGLWMCLCWWPFWNNKKSLWRLFNYLPQNYLIEKGCWQMTHLFLPNDDDDDDDDDDDNDDDDDDDDDLWWWWWYHSIWTKWKDNPSEIY